MKYIISKCEFAGFGVKQHKEGLYVSYALEKLIDSGIKLYDKQFKYIESISIPLDFSMGNVICAFVEKLNIEDCFYRFYKDKEDYIDPYSKTIEGLNEFGKQTAEDALFSKVMINNDLKGWNKDTILKTPYSESVFYIAHPRGFTMLDASINEGRGTFRGISQKALYLKKLGVTGIILMPVYERIECGIIDKKTNPLLKQSDSSINYWGFGPGFYYSLKKSYFYDGSSDTEFKNMIMSLHKNNIELILTFDFCNLPYEKISEILRYWIYNYHIDGFRVFGTSEINKLISDPFFKGTKIILENYYDIPNDNKVLYKNIAVFDDNFKDYARKFLKSDDDCVSKMSFYVRENHNNYQSLRNITDFDGFTLNDLVSYDRKHNELNNEDNLDGTNYNYSWNCGEEGESEVKQIQKLRLKQIKNALFLTFLNQGTPVITAGDELLNSSYGNNNPYCQDNDISWVKWDINNKNREIFKLIKDLLSFRNRHMILHQPKELSLFDYMSCKLPDVSFHGDEAWKYNSNPDSKSFSVLYAGDYAKQYKGEKECSVLIIYNMYWEECSFALPKLNNKQKWMFLCSTDSKCSFDEDKASKITQDIYVAEGRTVSILISK